MLKFPNDLHYVKEASNKVLSLLNDLRLDESILFDIKLCFEEAFINAIKYGNKCGSNLTVNVDVRTQDDQVEIIVCDQGKGFDLRQCDDPTKEENLAKTSGRGVFIIKHLMDEVRYNKTGGCLHMIKKISKQTGG